MTGWLSTWDERYHRLLTDISRECGFTRIRLIEDVSGASGAQTFIVQPTGLAGVPKIAVLKIGHKELIAKEVVGLKTAALYYAHANYRLFDSQSDDLRALLLDLAGGEDGTTFERFYLAPETRPEDVQAVIRDLFKKTLRAGFMNRHAERNPFALYKFHELENHSRVLRVLGDGLPTLVRWWQRAELLSNREPTHCSLCHGDLHRKNIIVSAGSAYVIDFGSMEEWHFMRDFAKFERDICLFLYPPESNSMELIEVEDFASRLVELSDGLDEASDSILQKARAALLAVRSVSRDVAHENWRFEYSTALLAQYIFAAGNEKLEIQTRPLALRYANRLRHELESLRPRLIFSEEERVEAYRRDALWRVAYSFFRMDQLPSGGWGKSLPGWLNALLEGDRGEVHRNPATRTRGGTDLTSRAFINYSNFLRRLGWHAARADDLSAKARIAQAVRSNMASKIGWDGGIGTGQVGKGSPPVVPVRHTLMGLLTFLYLSDCIGQPALDEIRKTEAFLLTNLKRWNLDTSHPFGCFCILAKTREVLAKSECQRWLRHPEKMVETLDRTLKEMSEALLKPSDVFDLKPAASCGLKWQDFRFRPYSGFWRMERSNLLMYLPFLIAEDGERLHPFLDRRLLELCALELLQVVRDLAPLPNGRHGMLVHYHRDTPQADCRPPMDWGLTAELLAVLRKPPIKRLLIEHEHPLDDKEYEHRVESLDAALHNSFDRYHEWPVFKYTHGVSVGCYLEAVDGDLINVEAVRELDERIDEMIDQGVTEHDLDVFIRGIIASVVQRYSANVRVSVEDIRDLMVDKLASGEYVPSGDHWLRKVDAARQTTVRYFDGKGGQDYPSSANKAFVMQIVEMVSTKGTAQRRALDVGCGPGQYAMLLEKEGYQVELADASLGMLRLAHRRLNRPEPTIADIKRVESLVEYYAPGRFDVIFASSIMTHVPQAISPAICQSFYELLLPGGALFINYVLGDNTLVGADECYFEYYRDQQIPLEMLQQAGFCVRHVDIGFDTQTRWRYPKQLRWANFFCTR